MTRQSASPSETLPGILSLELAPVSASRRRHAFRVAGRRLLADTALASLAPFAARPDAAVHSARLARAVPADETAVFAGTAWVCGRHARVSCGRAAATYVVRVADLPPLLVTAGGCAASRAETSVAPGDLAEAVLGPGLLLALALHGVFTLHAGAVAVDGAAVVLVGPSGAGKSTLARELAATPGCERLADDVLPCETGTGGLAALPHYPQLKLPAADQYAAGRPERVPVRAVYELCPADDARGPVSLAPVAGGAAVVVLAAHTVAARLFDAPLLERHLAFCSAAAAAAPVARVRFPRRLDALPAVVAALLADARGDAAARRR